MSSSLFSCSSFPHQVSKWRLYVTIECTFDVTTADEMPSGSTDTCAYSDMPGIVQKYVPEEDYYYVVDNGYSYSGNYNNIHLILVLSTVIPVAISITIIAAICCIFILVIHYVKRRCRRPRRHEIDLVPLTPQEQ